MPLILPLPALKLKHSLFRKDYGVFQGIVVFGKARGIIFAEDERAFVAIGAFVRGESEGGRKWHEFARHPFTLCGGNALRDDKPVRVNEVHGKTRFKKPGTPGFSGNEERAFDNLIGARALNANQVRFFKFVAYVFRESRTLVLASARIGFHYRIPGSGAFFKGR